MEDVLEIYHMPYDPNYPVVCMDESSKQLIGEVRDPIPCTPGHPARIDDEYVRNGVVEIFMDVEPLAGKKSLSIAPEKIGRCKFNRCSMNAIRMLPGSAWLWII